MDFHAHPNKRWIVLCFVLTLEKFSHCFLHQNLSPTLLRPSHSCQRRKGTPCLLLHIIFLSFEHVLSSVLTLQVVAFIFQSSSSCPQCFFLFLLGNSPSSVWVAGILYPSPLAAFTFEDLKSHTYSTTALILSCSDKVLPCDNVRQAQIYDKFMNVN